MLGLRDLQTRVRILHRVADSLQRNEAAIMAANQEDVAAFDGKIDDQLMQRLKLKHSKIASLVTGGIQGCTFEAPRPFPPPGAGCGSKIGTVRAGFGDPRHGRRTAAAAG